MLNEFQKDVAAYSLKKYGEESQILKTIEELGELSSALSRFLINKKIKPDMKNYYKKVIVEEVADVYIMLDQMCEVFEEGEVEDAIMLKTIGQMERNRNENEIKNERTRRMKNKEKHIDLLVECVTHNYCSEKLLDLVGIDCDLKNSCDLCRSKVKDWLEKEYTETPVDWNEIPIDTKV